MHTRDSTHGRNILDCLVGCTVRSNGQSAVRRDDLDAEIGIRDSIPDLVQAFTRYESRIGTDERNLARERQARSNPDHVGLRDSHVEETIRITISEQTRLYGDGSVGADHNDPRLFLS